ncbi:MAG: transposase [Luteolibacter sp.]
MKQSAIRDIVSSSLHHFDNDRYLIESYIIMPNHVHLLFRLNPPNLLPNIMMSIKSHTAKLINKHLNRKGSFWQRDYHDRLIRSTKHFNWAKLTSQKIPETSHQTPSPSTNGNNNGEPVFGRLLSSSTASRPKTGSPSFK